MVNKKVVVVGDGVCGKTSLSVVFSTNEFPETHVPTIYDTYTKTVEVDEHNVQLTICDTAGEEDYDRLRPLSYANTSVIIVCFAIDNPISLENVTAKWAPEVKYYRRKVPIILVGNKVDLRNNNEVVETLLKDDLHPVRFEEGKKVAKQINARDYIECSAKHMMGVQDVFVKAAQIALENNKNNYLCCIPKC